jgi:transposase
VNNQKYVGLDVDQATIVAYVSDAEGRFVMETMLETKPSSIRQFLKSLEGPVHVAFEEGCMAAWLYDLVRPLVKEVIVCDPRQNKLIQSGNKGDRVDANKLARLMRLGELRSVYHGDQSIRDLKELVHTYDCLVRDSTRTMNRLKAVYRGQGISSRGKRIYNNLTRDDWKGKLASEAARSHATCLYKQADSLNELRAYAKREMVNQARKHSIYKHLVKVPGFGPIRVSQLIAEVGTPYRFRTKRQFWTYCGFAVVTHMSSEYEVIDGQRRRRKKPLQTRGLNHNFNRRLKAVFKGAAVTAIDKEPFKQYYTRLIDNKMRSEMAHLTVARKISAIVLTMWKKGDSFNPDRVNQAEKAQEMSTD